MKLALACICMAALLSVAASPQSTEKPAAFGAADVHVTAAHLYLMNGPFIGGGLYRIGNATMVDLIATAYGVEPNTVAGGPPWLELDRFDLAAKLPPSSSAADVKVMLQTLLADRFKLAVHKGTSPVPAYALKATNKISLKPSDGLGESGCKTQQLPASFNITNGAVSYACRNMTMEAFAEVVRSMVGNASLNGYRVVDQTNLQGSWNFDVTFRRSTAAVPPGEEPLHFFDAIPKQLGLEVALVPVPMPAMVVDSVNETPTENPPNLTEALPVLPTAFEVADIKENITDSRAYGMRGQPGGRITFNNTPLLPLVVQAWRLRNSEAVSGPKFLETERFNILAKTPDLTPADFSDPAANRGTDNELIDTMLQSLLVERFKMAIHWEDRPVTSYDLKAAKPKLQRADPANRSNCLRDAGVGETAAQAANQVNTIRYTCRNMTMAQFAKFLDWSPYTPLNPRASIQDATGLTGAWDFNFAYSGAETSGVNSAEPSGGMPVASTPTGRITLIEALESQLGLKLEPARRPGRVLVIDHMEQKPAEK